MDGFPDEIRDVVHNHWASFPPQHPLVVDLFGVFFLVLTFISIFGNGLVIYIFLTTKSLRIPTNMFIINLAISDVGIMLTQGPLMFINAFSSDFWMWGSLLCKIYGAMGGIFGKLYLTSFLYLFFNSGLICHKIRREIWKNFSFSESIKI